MTDTSPTNRSADPVHVPPETRHGSHKGTDFQTTGVTRPRKAATDPRASRSHLLVGLVVRRPPRERKIPGSNLDSAGIFSGSSHTSDLKFGTQVATLQGAWRYRVSAGTGRPGVSIL